MALSHRNLTSLLSKDTHCSPHNVKHTCSGVMLSHAAPTQALSAAGETSRGDASSNLGVQKWELTRTLVTDIKEHACHRVCGHCGPE